MALSGLHLLLTYKCTSECDHCFVFGSPRGWATMTLDMIDRILDQADELGTVRSVFFEGGEPFLFYSTLREGILRASARGYWTGIVTNGYWATSADDAEKALSPLVDAGLRGIQVSSDELHAPGGDDPRPGFAEQAAEKLDVFLGIIAVDEPGDEPLPPKSRRRGEPVEGGAVAFRGRAAESLTEGLSRIPFSELDLCPHEELVSPSRVHIDPYGHVHICQGLLMGNLLDTPLTQMVRAYKAKRHPIVGPLLKGGPAALAKAFDLSTEESYVDACHLCYSARSQLREGHGGSLGPGWVYGDE